MTEAQTLPTTERLLALVDALAGRPVAMLVDLVADRFVTGTPKRISREAPVLILRYEGERLAPGGGANAVANVAALGARPLPLGVVGDDDSGRQLLAALAALGVDTRGILVRPGFRTPTKVRILGGARGAIKQQIVRYDIEDRLELTAEECGRLLATLTDWCCSPGTSAPVAVLSDYGYGTVRPDLLPALRSTLGPGSTILCDSRYRLGEFTGLDGATPNQEEAESLWGGPLEEGNGSLAAAGSALRRRLGARFLLVTRGSRGMALFTADAMVNLPVHGTDQVADVTGAGDTVIGTFALALAAGADPLEAALLANYAGGVVVMKVGTATLTREELAEAVRGDRRPIEELRWVAS